MAANTLSATAHLQCQNKSLSDTVKNLRLMVSTLESENQILKKGKDNACCLASDSVFDKDTQVLVTLIPSSQQL